MENLEITVKVETSLNELLNYLTSNNFRFHQSFRCIDIFMIKKEEVNNVNSYEDFKLSNFLALTLISFNKSFS